MICPSGADDTTIIQAALDSKGYAELDSGDFHVSTLNLTNRGNPVLRGQGTLQTRLHPTTGGVNVIDCTGTSNAQLMDFRIVADEAIKPWTGILSAQMAGPVASDVAAIERVRVDGFYSKAAWYCFGVESSRVFGSQFYNYTVGAVTAVMTSANLWNVVSQFTTIRPTNDVIVSDWEIIASEFHNMALNWAVWLGGVSCVKFRGGNASSSAPIVSNNAVVMASGQVNPDHVIFDGTTFYSDFAPTPAYAIGGFTAAPSLILRDVKATMPVTQ